MKNIRRLDISLIRRPASYRGPRSSEDWTDTIDELIRDFTELSNQWNTGVIPLITTLPDGSDDSLVDAFTDGIDGRTVYVDSSLTASSSVTTYWHATRERPKVVKEALEDLYSYIDTQITSVQEDVAAASGPLTAAQKARIGSNIFDETTTSSSTSLDGKSESNRLNLIQVATDLYGSAFYSLDSDGAANLTNSVRAMVDALLEAHGGNWDTDITLLHSGITLTQSDITQSAVYDDSYVGAPTDLEDDLNQIRTQIKTYGGGAAWTTTMPALYGGGADSLYGLLNSTAGSAAKSATNPWGYHYDDINGLATVLDALRDFVGQDGHTDDTPGYGTPHFVNNGDTLESGIRRLDDVVHSISGQFDDYEAFSGLIDTPDNYIDQSGMVLRVGNLSGATVDSGIVFDDYEFVALEDTPDNYIGNSGQMVRVNYDEDALEFEPPTFSGLTDTPYHYVGHSGQIVHVNGTEDELDFSSSLHIREDEVLETDMDIEITASGQGLVMVDSGTNRWRLHTSLTGVPYTLPADGSAADDLTTLFDGQDLAGDYRSELLNIEHISRVGFQIYDDGGTTTRAGTVYFRLTNDELVSGVAMAVPVVSVLAGININEYVEISDLASKFVEVLYDSSTSGPGETLTITAYRKYPN